MMARDLSKWVENGRNSFLLFFSPAVLLPSLAASSASAFFAASAPLATDYSLFPSFPALFQLESAIGKQA